MANQPLSKLAKLTEQFPSIARTRTHFMWQPEGATKLRYPKTEVSVQKADADLMYFQGKDTDHGGYVMRMGYPFMADLTQFVFAYDERGEPLGGALTWWDPKATKDVYAKDIFSIVDPEKVAYVTIESAYNWHKPMDKPGEFPYQDAVEEVEVDIVVYPKPKNMSWTDLIALSEKVKLEQENAWRYDPKFTPKLKGVHLALKKGLKLRAFSSGGGLRVVSLNAERDKEKAYGEHPHVEDALIHLDEDYLAGGRTYAEMYGPKGVYVHYRTGSTLSTSNIDYWLRRGGTLDAWQEGETIFFRLNGHKDQEMPEHIKTAGKDSPNKPFRWEDRGFKFVGKYCDNMFADGSGGFTWECLNPQKGSIRHTMYKIAKTGQGKTLWEAMKNAFEANEIEILKLDSK